MAVDHCCVSCLYTNPRFTRTSRLLALHICGETFTHPLYPRFGSLTSGGYPANMHQRNVEQSSGKQAGQVLLRTQEPYPGTDCCSFTV